jgi:uncharacterized protein
VLTGARQVGKTTLLRSLFPDYRYVSLDLLQDAEQAEHAPEEFLRRFSPPVVIDEVQYAPKIFRHLKVAIDANRNENGQFILTGSQKFTLMKEVSESLAGRCAVLELEGLSAEECGEVMQEQRVKHGAEAVLARGSMPELWEDLTISETEYFRSYLSSYLERDVRQILNVGSLRDFDRFLRVCATQNGQELNKSSIAQAVGVAQKTVTDWIGVLTASNQISLLEPYFGNLKKRIVKSPRLYFNDTGLLCFLLGLTKASLVGYVGVGPIWEAFVYGEVRKYRESYELEMSPWFYRDNRGTEVDLLLQRRGALQLAEIKWTEIPTRKMTKPLADLAQLVTPLYLPSLICCRTATPFPVTPEIQAIDGFRMHEALKKVNETKVVSST